MNLIPGEFFETAHDAMIVCDAEGVVVFANRQSGELLDCRVGDLIGTKIETVIPGSSAVRAGGTNAGQEQTDQVVRGREGTEFVANVSFRVVRYGSEPWMMAVLRRSKRLQTMQTHRDLASVWREMAIAEIGGSLAHELNQPLAAITLHCDAATSSAKASGAHDQSLISDLESATAQAFRASTIVSGLRQLAREDSPRRVVTHPNSIVFDALALAESEAAVAQIAFEVSLDRNLPEFEVDRVQMIQAILGLLRIAMHAERVSDEARRVELQTRYDAGAIKIRVQSAGLDLDPSIMDFRPVAAGRWGWVGLEFAICRRIAAAHGGSLAGPKHCGDGACLCIYLPAKDASRDS